jgi:thiol-disulfide isomerase/thioredoxin
MTKKLQLLTILFLGITLLSSAQGYDIKVKINGMKDSSIYLGYYFADKTYVKDTIKLDAAGSGTFKGKEKLDGGMYFIVLPNKTIAWEMLISDNQNFSVTADTGNFISSLKFKGSEENAAFNEYQRFISLQNKKMAEYQKRIKENEKNTDSTKVINESISSLDKDVRAKWDFYIEKYPKTFLANFLKAQQFPQIPDFVAPANVTNKDSAIQMLKYLYNKDHYFDAVDFSDARLLRTNLIYNRMNTFFTKIILHPDSIIKEGDIIIKKSKANSEVFRYCAEFLLNLRYSTQRMDMDKILVHFGEKYFLTGEATWVDSTRMEKIRERVIATKPNYIGLIAPDIKVLTIDNKIQNLHQIKAKYTILAFWEPSCGHCKKMIPKLHEVYNQLFEKKLDIKVLAVFTQVKEKEDWEKFIEEHALNDFINAYDPYGWSDFRKKYDIISTPVIYILDQNKKIIAKRIDVEKIIEFLDNYRSE